MKLKALLIGGKKHGTVMAAKQDQEYIDIDLDGSTMRYYRQSFFWREHNEENVWPVYIWDSIEIMNPRETLRLIMKHDIQPMNYSRLKP